MLDKKENISLFIGTFIYLILFLGLSSNFSHDSKNHFPTHLNEICFVTDLDNDKGVIIEPYHLPSCENCFLKLLRNIDFNSFNNYQIILAKNNNISHKFNLLIKEQLSIITVNFFKHQYHHNYSQSKEPPVLS